MIETDSAAVEAQPNHSLSDHVDKAALRSAIAQAIAPADNPSNPNALSSFHGRIARLATSNFADVRNWFR
jgi:hypothetical protein